MINYLISWALVAFGQPSWSISCSVLAAACGYALLWRTLFRDQNRRLRFVRGVVWFASAQLVQLSWFTSYEYHGMYILLVYIGIALWLGVQFGLLCLSFPRSGVPTVRRALAIASLWVLFEWGRLYFLCGFAWNPVGLALTAISSSSQLAALFGVLGLSFWVIFVNALALRSSRIVWGACALFPYLFGFFYIAYYEKNPAGSQYRVALVQTGMRPEEKMPLLDRLEAFHPPSSQWAQIIGMLDRADLQNVDLIVLPESSLPYGAHTPLYRPDDIYHLFSIEKEQWGTNADCAQALSARYEAEVIIGFDDTDRDSGRHFNAAFHYKPHQTVAKRYDKRVLVPLAEYLPFAFLRPIVAKYGIVEFFSHGKEATIFEGKRSIAASICYEECFSHIVREGVRGGADLLVNITNDYWYPNSRLPQQHFDHGRLRAIELGVPLVRACNTGVTAAVDPFGRTVDRIKGEWAQNVLVVDIDAAPHKTPFLLWGDWGIVSLSIAFLLGSVRRKRFRVEENIRER